MKEYRLQILYFTSNEYASSQSFHANIIAAHMDDSEGVYSFFDVKDELIASYPANCTIITEIVDA